MEELRIHLFGGVEVFRAGTLLPAFPTQKSLSLFAYLVLNRGRLVHRDTVCGQFWGEQSDVEARKALRTCLWRIRSSIEPQATDRGTLVQVEGSLIRFVAPERTWVDAWELEDSLRTPVTGASDGDGVERLEGAAALYRGDFLEGLNHDWCFLHRERLRLAYLTALERLLAFHKSRTRWLDVLTCGSQILRSDPLREHVHRALMEAHVAIGDRPSALRQYEICCRTLREELAIAPMEETRRLAAQIRLMGRSTEVSEPDESRAAEGHAEALLAEVEVALAALHTLASRLERTRGALVADAAGHPVPSASRARRLLEAPGA
jgi:DNA-binding SARP family transcriptional activator